MTNPDQGGRYIPAAQLNTMTEYEIRRFLGLRPLEVWEEAADLDHYDTSQTLDEAAEALRVVFCEHDQDIPCSTVGCHDGN